ncbi:MAG: lyase family protein [Candidatus Falkowbacteria bacterium]
MTMEQKMCGVGWLEEAIEYLEQLAMEDSSENRHQPTVGRYQPKPLVPYFGYDFWAKWLVLVEWAWLLTLAKAGIIPKEYHQYLSQAKLHSLLKLIATTEQDQIEKAETKGHDINALIILIRRQLPESLRRFVHLGPTSYDIISTAYALQLKLCHQRVVRPMLGEIDELWRGVIHENAELVQLGRTHLQAALPITGGFWLATLHTRYARNVKMLDRAASELEGKFTGAVGTRAAQVALFGRTDLEDMVMHELGLIAAPVSTQIAPPESVTDYYYYVTLLSGVLANLGNDVRTLQSTQYGEIDTIGSTSSTMSHKRANPTAAENPVGMYRICNGTIVTILTNLSSDLGRDLCNSGPMRMFASELVYFYQSCLSIKRMFKSMEFNASRCQENFERYGKQLPAELLHLTLQLAGLPVAHKFVNEVVSFEAIQKDCTLDVVMNQIADRGSHPEVAAIWEQMDEGVKSILANPALYLGDAVFTAFKEAQNIC